MTFTLFNLVVKPNDPFVIHVLADTKFSVTITKVHFSNIL